MQYAEELSEVFSQLRYLLTGGDIVDQSIVARVLGHNPPLHLLNAYGPTECTTFTTTYEIGHELQNSRRLPIGTPISNTRVYILDAHLRPVPRGCLGELFIGGDGVALGCIGRPELTAERFVADPFASHSGATMYKTGGRWRADGVIEFPDRSELT